MNSRELLLRVEAGDGSAATEVFDRYVERLLALVRARIGKKLARRLDAEDVVQSAYRSFFVHAENGEYALGEAGDLWRLLARIALNKLYSQVEKHTAERRDIRREHETDHELRDDPATTEPTAAEAIALGEQLQLITKCMDSTARSVMCAYLRGDTVDQIASVTGKSPRTVRRTLANVRQTIEGRLVTSTEMMDDGARLLKQHAGDPRLTLSYSDFRLERLLGSGGMGKVYRAIQQSTGQCVAIKSLLKSRLADRNSIEKFLEEAEILASLDHPNIVRFRGAGRFPNGGYFLAMDFIDGADLQSRIAARPLPVGDALRVVRIASEAIAHAHERGIVHGDIKPGNVIVDRAERVFVTDFGLAQFCSAKSAPKRWLIGGTAGYLAPEVREKDLPSTAADIYGLGALLWSLVTGSPPHGYPPCKCEFEFPPALYEVLANCLAFEPSQRLPSAAALAEHLGNLEIEASTDAASSSHSG